MKETKVKPAIQPEPNPEPADPVIEQQPAKIDSPIKAVIIE